MDEKVWVLDACALIAALRGEPGGDRVLELLTEPEARSLMHALNLCEVYYDAVRRDPRTHLVELLAVAAALGVEIVYDFGVALLDRAGRLKAERRRVSLADCVALAYGA
ncbi:MAG: PIN domain-containing protein [Deferrisomatales bacterium]